MERYKTLLLASTTINSRHPMPATLNRKLACLKHMFNVGRKGLTYLKGGKSSNNPVNAVKFLDEQNNRDRVLTQEEFDRMLETSPGYLKPIFFGEYHTGACAKGKRCI